MARGGEGDTGLFVPARVIPVPRTVSPQAQAFLAHLPPFEPPPTIAVDDIARWRAYADEQNRGLLAFAAQQAKAFPADTVKHELSASTLYEITPHNLAADHAERAILYVHGGGFITGGGEAAGLAATPIAGRARARTYAIDYRTPPDHPFPAAVDDCVEAYSWLLSNYRPENIAVWGGSAGGSIAPAALLHARDLGLPLPAACALHSPASDATESGDTYETNSTLDTVLRGRSSSLYALYSAGHDLKDPLISPLHADFSKGFPPTVLTSGTRDALLSSTVLLHRALRRAGVKAELHVWEAMPHCLFFGAPEEEEVYGEHIKFMHAHMGEPATV
jgi:acetyl esterase/lipase